MWEFVTPLEDLNARVCDVKISGLYGDFRGDGSEYELEIDDWHVIYEQRGGVK